MDAVKRYFPDNPLKFIQRCVRERKIFWTYHVNLRLRGRFIPSESILESWAKYEMVEEYPTDKYLPSYLLYSEHQGERFHVLFAVDVEGDNVRVVTAYRPSVEEWEDNFKKRRRSS
jgi:hypothetical protein